MSNIYSIIINFTGTSHMKLLVEKSSLNGKIAIPGDIIDVYIEEKTTRRL